MMTTTPRKKAKLLIYPQLQFALIGLNLVIALAFFFAAIFAVSHSYEKLNQQGVAMQLPANHAYFAFVQYQSGMVYKALTIALIGSFLVSTVMTLLLSHRMAGPIARLKTYFKEIGDGKTVQPVKFRKKDFFSDLPELINRALSRLANSK